MPRERLHELHRSVAEREQQHGRPLGCGTTDRERARRLFGTQVGFFGTRTTPWERVAALRTVQQPVRWLGLPRTVQGQALILVRSDRPAQDAPVLLTTHNADFVARPGSFDRAADTIEAWAAENRRSA